MKSLVNLILLVVLFSSCKTARVSQIVTETKWKDTTVYVEIPVYIDKIIEVPLPKDTIRIKEKVNVDKNGLAEMNPVHKEQGIIGADIVVKNGILDANLFLLDSAILFNYKDTLTGSDSVKIYDAVRNTKTTETIVLPPEKFIPKIFWITFWIFIVELIIIVLIVLAKIGVLNIPFLNITKKL